MATPFFVTTPPNPSHTNPFGSHPLPGENTQIIEKPKDWHPAETEPSQTLPVEWTNPTPAHTDISLLPKFIQFQESYFSESLTVIQRHIDELNDVKNYLIRCRDGWKNQEPPAEK